MLCDNWMMKSWWLGKGWTIKKWEGTNEGVSVAGLEGVFLLSVGIGVEMRERIGGAAERGVHGAVHLVQTRCHRLPLLRHRPNGNGNANLKTKWERGRWRWRKGMTYADVYEWKSHQVAYAWRILPTRHSSPLLPSMLFSPFSQLKMSLPIFVYNALYLKSKDCG